MKTLHLFLLAALAGTFSCNNPGNAGDSANSDSTAAQQPPAANDSGLLLVANKLDNTLFFINAETLELVDSTTTGNDPHEAVVTPDGRTAYTANMTGNSLSVIDMNTLEEVRRIDLSKYQQPHGLAITSDGKNLYVTTEGTQTVLEIDVAADSILRVFKSGQQGTHMAALSKDESTLYAPNLGSGTTTVIDLEAGEVIKTLATGEGTEGIDVSPDGKEIWITARSGSVAVVNAESNEIEATLPAAGLPIRVKFTPDGKQALVSCMQADEVIVFDVAERKPIKRIKTGAGPVGVLIRPDGEVAFVANTEGNNVSVIDMKTLEVSETIPAGDTPDGMAFR
ncbi:YVTN family beta-propeller protein [Anseongella ginsenosidimutans]|uniref:YVTN family beta-propeller protein n=1 Tax=Anseongella ginsenosidimutans TaxID=496056 RepID=A0A4R3KUT7_9SPHI|nr:cytochrome D1 domain-containing protein [Anseongella ginsenosidimutans]QEC51827.1 beta-propeller fold lactonase family protein [Anseongella ginsenosidimutans]TCS89199.1 YVTN family beta-propeller protein [Anseongella ginsenosidimutans]